MPLTKAKTFTPTLALNKYQSGHFYTLPIIATTTAAANSGFMITFPIYFPNITIDRIGCLVTVAG